MVGGEINVAYDGTFGDLSATGDSLFNVNETFDFNQLMGVTDGFTAINTRGVTVSPKDVFNNDSIPPSTSFTNLTTPGSILLETPDEDYQTSPLINDSFGTDSHGADSWFSLFPDDGQPAPTMARTISASSSNQIMVHPGGEGNRKRNSSIASPTPFSPVNRHSDAAGVNARKRDKPLPPIMVDESDPVAVKRGRNTAAARKSRDKKVKERELMLQEIDDLKAQVEHWKSLALNSGIKSESSDE